MINNLNLDTSVLEVTKWKGKEDLLLQELSNLWKDIKIRTMTLEEIGCLVT